MILSWKSAVLLHTCIGQVQLESQNSVSHTSGAQAGRRGSACAAARKVLQWLQGLHKPYLIASKKIKGVPSLQIRSMKDFPKPR